MNSRAASRMFPGRIGRALTVGTAVAIAGVVLVGGVSLWLAFRVHASIDATATEYRHLLSLDEVHALFDDLIFELHQADETRQAEHAADAVLIHDRLVTQIESLQREHAHADRPAERQRVAAMLGRLRADAGLLGAVALRVRAGHGGLTRDDRATLVRVTREVPQRTGELGSFHRTRIDSLVHESKRQIAQIVTLYTVFVAVGGALALLASVAASQRITGPLGRLARASRRIARGRLETRVPVQSVDEIGMLSRSFNVMAEKLQGRERDLRDAQAALEDKVRETRALHSAGLELSRLQQLDRMLQYVVDKSRELLRVDAIALRVASPDGGAGPLDARSGPPEAFHEPADPDTSLAVPHEWRADDPPLRPAYTVAHLCAPVYAGDAVLGEMHAGSASPREFCADDAQLLEALAGLAALAIERSAMVEERRAVAAVEERGRLAREMHDGLAQALGLLHLKLQRGALRAGADPTLATELREMVKITDHAYEDVRHAILGLRSYALRGRGLVESLTQYVQEFGIQSGITVELSVEDGGFDRLPRACEVQIIRIIQEALANVRKHAGVRHATVRLERDRTAVRVTIADEGAGFDSSAGERALHYGLETMRERAESTGGTLAIDSAPGRGTRVVASFPRIAA